MSGITIHQLKKANSCEGCLPMCAWTRDEGILALIQSRRGPMTSNSQKRKENVRWLLAVNRAISPHL